MSWNYRVIEFITRDGDPWLAIHEVYYHGSGTDSPRSYSADPAIVGTGDGLDALGWTLDRMREALAKPVLAERDFTPGDAADDDGEGAA